MLTRFFAYNIGVAAKKRGRDKADRAALIRRGQSNHAIDRGGARTPYAQRRAKNPRPPEAVKKLCRAFTKAKPARRRQKTGASKRSICDGHSDRPS